MKGKFLYHRIREIRKAKGLTLEQFAQRLYDLSGKKFTAATISNYETGTYEPGLQILPYIAGALGVSIEELFENNPGSLDVEDALIIPDPLDVLEEEVTYWLNNPDEAEVYKLLALLQKSMALHKEQKEENYMLKDKLLTIRKFISNLNK